MPSAVRVFCVGFVSFLSIILVSEVYANMGSPYRRGDRTSEPGVGSNDVEVLREDLRIDLHELTDSGKVLIEAVYLIKSDHAIELPLLFVAKSLELGGNSVRLDEQPVSHIETLRDTLPPGWNVPSSLTLDSSYHIQDLDSTLQDGTLRFIVKLTPGEHVIRVRYRTIPHSYARSNERTVRWLLSYTLSPAKEWKSFGELSISVKAPQSWSINSNLTFVRSGDSITAHYNGIPADDLSLLIQAPAESRLIQTIFLWGFTVMMTGGIFFLGVIIGRRLQRRGRTALWMLPVNTLLGVAIGTIFIVLAILLFDDSALGEHKSWAYSYGHIVQHLFLAFCIGAFVMLLGQIGVLAGKRREREEIAIKQMLDYTI